MVGGKFGWPDLAILAVPVAYVGFFLSLTGNNASPVGNTAEAPILAASVAPITPLQAPRGLDTAKVALGRKLFEDERLSANGQVSCASCHDLSHGGADSARASTGVSGEPTAVNTPTVFNSGNSAAQFWDGRAATLEEQIDGPLQHPDEMGATWTDVLTVVRSDPDYVSMFFAVYARAPSKERIKDAIATFERSLVTVNAPFDRFLGGDQSAISPEAARGYDLFREYGCISCHQGRNLGGNLFQRLGIVEPYFTAGDTNPANLGRFNVTGQEHDKHVFKVPSLRNVALTAPYFHDGSVRTLEQAISIMAYYQLGRAIEQPQIGDIAAFLRTLTGETPASLAE